MRRVAGVGRDYLLRCTLVSECGEKSVRKAWRAQLQVGSLHETMKGKFSQPNCFGAKKKKKKNQQFKQY